MTLRSFTLHDQIERNALLHGSGTAFVADGQSITHAQYAARVASLAAGLAGEGITVGDRVAILAHNGQAYVDVIGAAARLGALVVPINWRLSAEEVAHVLSDTTPKLLIVAPDLQPLVAGADIAGVRKYTTGPGADAGAAGSALASLYLEGAAPTPAAIGDDAGLLIVHTAAVGGR
ncbi:MAG: AMP-binding protein, partial [Rubrivivax sp.]